MPSATALVGLPVCGTGRATAQSELARSERDGTGEGRADAANALLTNLLHQTPGGHVAVARGVYIGEGLAPVPRKLADRIWKWEFIDMGELLPEFWGLDGKSGLPQRKTRVVAEILTWIQCFSAYVSVQSAQHPEATPELMAYMAMIVRASQDFKDLAWVRYDTGFRRQAALTKNQMWSRINTTLYSMCFTSSFRGGSARCELCFGTTHGTSECALQGDPDPEMRDRVKAVESTLLALTTKQPRRPSEPVQRSGQVCRLFNQGRCNYARCKHAHECMQCQGPHPMTRCQRGAAANSGSLTRPGRPGGPWT